MLRPKKLPAWLSRRGYRDRLKQRIATMHSRDRDAETMAELPLPEEQSARENVLLFPLSRVLGRPAAALLLGFCLRVACELEGAQGSVIMQITGAA